MAKLSYRDLLKEDRKILDLWPEVKGPVYATSTEYVPDYMQLPGTDIRPEYINILHDTYSTATDIRTGKEYLTAMDATDKKAIHGGPTGDRTLGSYVIGNHRSQFEVADALSISSMYANGKLRDIEHNIKTKRKAGSWLLAGGLAAAGVTAGLKIHDSDTRATPGALASAGLILAGMALRHGASRSAGALLKKVDADVRDRLLRVYPQRAEEIEEFLARPERKREEHLFGQDIPHRS